MGDRHEAFLLLLLSAHRHSSAASADSVQLTAHHLRCQHLLLLLLWVQCLPAAAAAFDSFAAAALWPSYLPAAAQLLHLELA
jgi:hypothetical protein